MPQLTIIMGVSGSGKSTIGEALALQTESVFLDADDFHSPASREKMSQGIPLEEIDRAPWVDRLYHEVEKVCVSNNARCVLAFSGLKRHHREAFRRLSISMCFVYLALPVDEIERRLASRQQHFFNSELLFSQFADMEAPLGEQDILVVENRSSVARVTINLLEKLAEKHKAHTN